ncbi:MAG: FISUMP domain-containing protein [Patescibacteria group bacterium]|jgi:uncharacterized protein (TIGR02145 family)
MKEYKINQIGFTLVEVLLVVTMFTIILSSVISLTTNQILESDLAAKSLEVTSLLETARNNSATGYRGDVWSIKVLDSDALCQNSGDCILLFKGNNFSTRDTAYDRFVQFDVDVSGVYVNVDQENEFYFAYSSGWLATTSAAYLDQQYIVLNSNFGQKESILIYPTGVISTFVCGEDKLFDINGNGYTTVQIGNQCWMAENLNTGTMLASASIDPSDDGTIQKWCYSDTSSNCNSYGGLYDIVELLAYNTSDSQGICPAGWHIPTEAEINTLESNYSNGVDEGYNLRLGGISGFNLPFSGQITKSTNAYADITTLSTIWSSYYTGTQGKVYYINDSVDADVLTALLTASPSDKGYAARCLKDY